jgi:hypothetical protein
MKYFFYFILVLLLSCNQKGALNPEFIIPSASELANNFKYEYISADTIHIFSKDDAYFSNKLFESIIVGSLDESSGFIPKDTVKPAYVESQSGYWLRFSHLLDLSQLIDISSVQALKITLRFMLNPNDFRQIIFDLYHYKYPYETVTLYLEKSTIPEPKMEIMSIRDFAIHGQSVFLLMYNNYEIYKYQLVDNKVIPVTGYYHSENCVYDNEYLYIDTHVPHPVSRYNLNTNEFDLGFEIENYTKGYIRGMDVYKNKLYILFHTVYEPVEKFLLISYHLNGEFIKSVEIPDAGWGMSIHNDIIHTRYWYYTGHNQSHTEIRRISLKDYTLLTPIISTSQDIDVLDIKNDKLYFSLYSSQAICYIPYSDLKLAE